MKEKLESGQSRIFYFLFHYFNLIKNLRKLFLYCKIMVECNERLSYKIHELTFFKILSRFFFFFHFIEIHRYLSIQHDGKKEEENFDFKNSIFNISRYSGKVFHQVV